MVNYPALYHHLNTITIPTSTHLITKERKNIKLNKINGLRAIRREHLKEIVERLKEGNWGKYTHAGIEDINFYLIKK